MVRYVLKLNNIVLKLSKLPSENTENLTKNVVEEGGTNEPATVKSCSIVTASRELLTKKDPANGVTTEKPRFQAPDDEPME